ncbi:RhuM family protein [Spirochaeta dissipatitropha]
MAQIKLGGGHARQLSYVASQLRTTGGYPQCPKQATQFRIWATAILKEYIIKGFAMDDEEIKDLNEIVTMYLDYAERKARKRRTVTMAEWSGKLDAFLKQ